MAQPAPAAAHEFQTSLVQNPEVGCLWHLRLDKDVRGRPLVIPPGVETFHPIRPEEFFGIPGPIEVEIGCGKGRFMALFGQRHPDRAYLGIDNVAPIAREAARKVAKRSALDHTRVLHGDAPCFLRNYLATGAVQSFHIYFPDPWHKRRQHKRRLLQEELLGQMIRTACPGAHVYWRTDHLETHTRAMKEFAAQSALCPVTPLPVEPFDVLTGFESKYVEEGRPIYRTAFEILK